MRTSGHLGYNSRSKFMNLAETFPANTDREVPLPSLWGRLVARAIGRSLGSFALLAFCSVAVSCVCSAQGYRQDVIQSWNFATASTTLGWAPVVPLTNFGTQNGSLTFTATQQTYTICSGPFSFSTAPMQLVQIVMSSNTAGASKVFWAPQAAEQCSGFQGGDENDFTMVGDGAFHHYYLPINTSSASSIFQLRLDVPPGATVSIQSIALVNLVAPSGPGVNPSWTFSADGDSLGWIPYQGVVDMSVSGGSLRLASYANSTILAPVAQVTNQLEWFSLMGAVTQTTLQTPWIQFQFASSGNSGSTTSVYFPVIPDYAQHVYNTNVGGASGWYSTVSQLSIMVPETTTLAISQIQVTSAPQGQPDLALDACGPATPLIRAAAPFQISCRVSNRGAQPIQGVSATLSLPSDGSVSVVSSPSFPQSLANGYPQILTWSLLAQQPETIQISVSADSANGGSAQAATTMMVNPPVTPQSSPYVPPPVPVYSDYDVGIYYFPGWNLDSHWDPIRNFPERMPALGYYAEGAPQVLDWQIKWAVEHGVSFFAVDWSWYGQGMPTTELGEQPNPFLQAYFASTYHDYIKYCIAYAGNSPTTNAESISDLLTITQAWINEYFSEPGYYMINGAPVVFVLDPGGLDSNLGGSAKQGLEAARQLAKAQGYNGIYFIAATNDVGFASEINETQLAQLFADGYDALSGYGSDRAGTDDPDESPYTLAVSGIGSLWDAYISASTAPYLIPTSPGFDLRPWATFDAPFSLVRTGSTAALFQQMLQSAKTRMDSGKSPPILLVEAWNELGEGSYVEPDAGRGFSYLDAIRSVFVNNSPHTDLAPADVGLPLVQTVSSPALWTFTDSSDLAPWQVAAGPPFYSDTINVTNSQVANDEWTFTSSGNPDMTRMGFNLSALDYSGIAIRMSVSADTNVNIYWGAVDEPGSSALRNAGFVAKAAAVQTYNLNLAGQPGWRGTIDLIRLTMSCPPNTDVAIQSIQFLPSAATPALVASKSQVRFTVTAGAAVPSPQVISVAGTTGSALSWTATSNASWLALSSNSGTTPSDITVTINLSGLAVGVYRTTVTLANSGAANSPLTIPVTLWVLPAALAPPSPSISAVVNGADFKSETLSPGAWISILGQNLGQTETASSTNTLTLGGASVSVCGIAAILNYNSGPVTTNGSTGWQINALVPDGVAGQTSCPVVASVGGQASSPVTVAIASGIMELFQFTTSVGTLPIITHADYSLVGPTSVGLVPAKPSETVIAWATGDCSTPAITVSGSPAAVAFSGPVEPGLCQVNFVVPHSPPGGDQLSLSSSPNTYSLWISQ